MWTASLCRRDLARLVLTLTLLLPAGVAAREVGPQGVVRQFCQADGNGQRVRILGWAALAPLVTWAYEPAWDHVVLIAAYLVGSPQPAADHSLAVEVRYDVVGELSASGLDPETHAENLTYLVRPDEQGNWHILGPPTPPHLFVNLVDINAMRRSLSDGGVNFLADTVFVWQMFRSVGWNVPYEPLADLLIGSTYQAVDKPQPGNLVVYLRDEVPYHVGLLEAQNQVVSSTLNAGIARTTVDTFPGEIRYLRIVQTEAGSLAADAAARQVGTPAMRPTLVMPDQRPTPAMPVAKATKQPVEQQARPSRTSAVRKKPAPSVTRAARKPAATKMKAAKPVKALRKAQTPTHKRTPAKGKSTPKPPQRPTPTVPKEAAG